LAQNAPPLFSTLMNAATAYRSISGKVERDISEPAWFDTNARR
jgi:hypothetical protein